MAADERPGGAAAEWRAYWFLLGAIALSVLSSVLLLSMRKPAFAGHGH